MFKILSANEMIKINRQIDLAQAFLICKMVYVNRSLFFYWGSDGNKQITLPY